MSWFGSDPTVLEMEQKIEEATSESIPNGELDLLKSLEITDLIRSKKINSKHSMRLLKKRLISFPNPNIQLSTLKLIDTCVKNSGFHFLIEISSREFMDSLVILLQQDSTNKLVGDHILGLINEWAIAFKGQMQLNYVEKTYDELISRGFIFPKRTNQLSSKFIESEVPPDWVDSDACMICSNQFSMINRKHHCRSCGGCYCQEHSSKSLPLTQIGITEPVRVCDTCYSKNKYKKSSGTKKKSSHGIIYENENETVEDEDLKKAIELSLRESGQSNTVPTYSEHSTAPTVTSHASIKPIHNSDTIDNHEEEEDEDMKAAIEASLRDFEQQGQEQNQPETNEQQSNFYNNLLPPQSSIPEQSYEHQETNLTNQEEESINLFINLMERMKLQPPGTIVQDGNLHHLHEQIKQLKPKLNESTKESIDKYDVFMELNNKISTINRLYDQLLESKLSRTYSQSLQPQYSGYQYGSPYGSGNFIPPQQTGQFSPQQAAAQQTGQYFPQSSHIAPQQTGQFNPLPQHITEQQTGQYIPQQRYYEQVQPQYTGYQAPSQYHEQEPSAPSAPSEPAEATAPLEQYQSDEHRDAIYAPSESINNYKEETPRENDIELTETDYDYTKYKQFESQSNHQPQSPIQQRLSPEIKKQSPIQQRTSPLLKRQPEIEYQAPSHPPPQAKKQSQQSYELPVFPTLPAMPELPSYNIRKEPEREEVALIEL